MSLTEEAMIDAGKLIDPQIQALKDVVDGFKEQFKIDWNTTNKRIDALQRACEKLTEEIKQSREKDGCRQ